MYHFCHTLLVKAVTRFKGRGCGLHLSMGAVAKNISHLQFTTGCLLVMDYLYPSHMQNIPRSYKMLFCDSISSKLKSSSESDLDVVEAPHTWLLGYSSSSSDPVSLKTRALKRQVSIPLCHCQPSLFPSLHGPW